MGIITAPIVPTAYRVAYLQNNRIRVKKSKLEEKTRIRAKRDTDRRKKTENILRAERRSPALENGGSRRGSNGNTGNEAEHQSANAEAAYGLDYAATPVDEPAEQKR